MLKGFLLITWGLIYKTVHGIATKSVRTPKSQVLRAPKNIPIYKTLRTHTCTQSLLYKSHTDYNCAQLNQLHVPPSTRPFLTINGQCKWPHECDLHIKQTQMQVLCLVGNNGRSTENSKKAKFHGGWRGDTCGWDGCPKSSFVQQKVEWVATCWCSSELCQ